MQFPLPPNRGLTDLLIPEADGHSDFCPLGSEKGIFETDNVAGQTWGPASLPEVKLNPHKRSRNPYSCYPPAVLGTETAKHPAEGLRDLWNGSNF